MKDHRNMVCGGHAKDRWHEGILQLELLKSYGLEPTHKLLDIGCGCFRLGIHAIPYLDHANYYGMDRRWDIVQAGIIHELNPRNLEPRDLWASSVFAFGAGKFDFFWAYSIFTHLQPDGILQCLTSVASSMDPGSRFLASYNQAHSADDENHGVPHPEYNHFVGCQYTASRIEALAAQAGLHMESLPERCTHDYGNQPHLQNMLLFTPETS